MGSFKKEMMFIMSNLKNKTKITEYHKTYQEENKEKIEEYNKKYCEMHFRINFYWKCLLYLKDI